MVEGYRPSTDDILRTRIITKGISEINFKIKVTYNILSTTLFENSTKYLIGEV